MRSQIERLPQLAKQKLKENRKFFEKLKKKRPVKLDAIMQDLHEDEFSRIDCLDCGNCCRTTGPLVTKKDIERVSKHLKLKADSFIQQYLRLDEDNDYVFKNMPCPFLGAENYCFIYDFRPKACREFPHTNRKRFYQILNISLKNIAVCPAVYNIVENLKQQEKLIK